MDAAALEVYPGGGGHRRGRLWLVLLTKLVGACRFLKRAPKTRGAVSQDDTAHPQIDVTRLLTRGLKTIVFADLVESVRLIEQDEEGTIRRWRAFVDEVVRHELPQYEGRLFKSLGDGLLFEFASPLNAVRMALALQPRLARFNLAEPPERELWLRVGVNAADVVIDDLDVLGAGVNLAVRLTGLAGPGEVVISADVRHGLVQGLDVDVEDLGDCHLKHVAEPVRVYRVAVAAGDRVREDFHMAPVQANIRPTIAVLPFADYGAPTGILGLGDILTDQVISMLSRTATLNVISQLSVNAFRGRAVVMTELMRVIAADYVLSGKFFCTNSRVALNLELTNTVNQRVIWADRVEGSAIDVASINSDLVTRIASIVANAITARELREARMQALPTLASHTLYLAAVSMLHRFALADFEQSKRMLEALHERAPRHAAPLAWLARWHVFRVVQGWSNDVDRDSQLALDFAKRALDNDPDSSLALTMAGSVYAGVKRDLGTARAYYDHALDANPNEPLAWLLKGVAHGFLEEANAALESSERALALSPLDPMRFYYDSLSATAAMGAGEYARAVTLAQRAIRANRTHGSAYRALAIAQGMLGLIDDSRRTVEKLMVVEPQSTVKQFLSRAAVRSERNERFAQVLKSAGLPFG
jgi:adenylate cyclase